MGRGTNDPRTRSAEGAKSPKAGRRRPRRGEPGFVYNRVRVLRQEREISREEMSEALGINYRTLGYMERQQYEPKLGLAWKVSEYFGLPMDAVFSRESLEPLSRIVYGEGPTASPEPPIHFPRTTTDPPTTPSETTIANE